MPDYRSLSDQEQVEHLRAVALPAAERFGVKVGGLELVLHSYNTTFALTSTSGERFALRVNTNSQSRPENLIAQIAWVRALAAQTQIVVAEPVATPTGEYVVEISSPVTGPVTVVLNTWLEGPDLDALTEAQGAELGRVMRALHAHGSGWHLPPDGALAVFDDPFMGTVDLLSDSAFLDRSQRDVVAHALAQINHAFDQLRSTPPIVAHADLHGGNLKLAGDSLAVFDFDDACLARPVQDLAISAFYLRRDDPGVEQAMLSAYGEPPEGAAFLEDLVAARQLHLANALLSSTTGSWRDQAKAYVALVIPRLEAYLRTGRLEFV